MEGIMVKKIQVSVLSLMTALCVGVGVASLNNVADASAEAPVLSESVKTTDMIKAVVNAGKGSDETYSNSISMNLFSYSLGYGKVDATTNTIDYHSYEVSSGSGLKTNAVYNTAKYQYVFYTNGMRVGNFSHVDGTNVAGNFHIIYRLTATEDVEIAVTHGSKASMPANLLVKTYEKNATTISEVLNYQVPTANLAENAYGGTYSIEAGEELIFEFAYGSEAIGSIVDTVNKGTEFYPTFTVSVADALTVKKVEATNSLTAAKGAVDQSAYAATDYEEIVAIYDEAIADVAEATELSAIDAIVAQVATDVADYLTTDAASEYRATVKGNMDAYVATIDSSLYKAETYQSVVALGNTIETVIAELTKKSEIDAAYNAIVAQMVAVEKDAPVTELTTTYAEIVNGVIGAGVVENKGYAGYGTNQLVSYTVAYGKVPNDVSILKLKGFETADGGLATSAKATVTENDESKTVSSSSVTTSGAIRVSTYQSSGASNTAFSGNVVFELVAKENIKVTVSHEAGEAIDSMYVKTFKSEEGGIYQLNSVALGEGFAANAYGGVWTVAKGDSLFVEVAMEHSGFATGVLEAIPSFFVETIEESELVTAIPSDDELAVLNSSVFDMITTTVEVGGGKLKAKAIDWQLLHGAVDNATTYEIVGGGVLRTEKKNASNYNSIYAANIQGGNQFVRTDPNNNESFIVKIVARENIKVSITSEAWQKGTHGLAGTYSSVVAHYDETTEEWIYYTYDAKKVSYPTELEAGVLNVDIHVNAGDIFYYVIDGANHNTNMTFMPTINADPAGYDADSVFDFVTYMQTQAKVAEETAKLQQAYDNLGVDVYSTDDFLELCAIYEEAIAQIVECSTMEDLNAFLNTLNGKLNDFIKVADMETEKTAILATMQGYIDALNKDNYKAETWESILAIKANLADELDETTKRSAQQELLQEAKAELDLIQEDKEAGLFGCGGSIVGLTGLPLLGAAVVVLLKKKENE